MSTHLAIRAFVLWPAFQAVRLLTMGGCAVLESLWPSCGCGFWIRMRQLWTTVSVEAWKVARAGGIGVGATLAGSSAYATALCGDWGEAAVSFRAAHHHCRASGSGGPDGASGE